MNIIKKDLKSLAKQFIKFCLFGAIRTIISMILFSLLVSNQFSLNQAIYSVWSITLIFTFMTNLKYVFQTRFRTKSFFYYAIYSTGYVSMLSLTVSTLNTATKSSIIAYMCSIIILLPLNFLISKKIMLDKNI